MADAHEADVLLWRPRRWKKYFELSNLWPVEWAVGGAHAAFCTYS